MTGLAPVISIGILSIHFITRKNTFHFVRTTPAGKDMGGYTLERCIAIPYRSCFGDCYVFV